MKLFPPSCRGKEKKNLKNEILLPSHMHTHALHLAVSLQEKLPDELECVTKTVCEVFPQGSSSSTGTNHHPSTG